VIENVRRVDTELKRLGLRDLERFRKIAIQPPPRERGHRGRTEVSLCTGLRILQQGNAEGPVTEQDGTWCGLWNNNRQTPQSAIGLEVVCSRDARTLRVCVGGVLVREVGSVLSFPSDFALGIRPGTDDIRPSIAIEEVIRRIDASWRSGRNAVNEPELPSLKSSGEPATAICEQQLVGSDRQLECAVGSEIASDALQALAKVQLRSAGIRKAAPGLNHSLAQAVRCKKAQAMSFSF